MMPILDSNDMKLAVSTSTNWKREITWMGEMMPTKSFSLTKWQSNSTLLVLSWKMGFLVRCMAAWLSQYTRAGCECWIWKSLSKTSNQTISQKVWAKARYSASANERDTVACFLDFQLIKESPIKTQKLVTDLRVSGQAAQSESLKAFKCKGD